MNYLMMPDLEEKYSKLRALMMQQLSSTGLIVDLNDLPTEPVNLKEAVIKWLIQVNTLRIERGEDPIVTLDLLLKCPVWRVIDPPIKRMALTKSGVFNKPGVKVVSKKSSPGSINKGKR